MKKQLLLLVMMLLPMVTMADKSGTCGDYLTWTLVESTGTLNISGTGTMPDFSYSGNTIPWYTYRLDIIEVIIEEGVTSIGEYAFLGCSGLTSITISNSVTSIGNAAFYNCISLTSVTIGNAVTTIGRSAFLECSSLTSITIPASVTTIGSYAFRGCSSMKSVTIGNGVLTIGDNAFNSCPNLTSITIPSSVTTIGSYAFDSSTLKKTIWLTNTPPTGYTYASGAVNYVANNQFSSDSNWIVYPFLSSMFDVDGIVYVPISPSDKTCDAIDYIYDNSITEITLPRTVSYKGVIMEVQNLGQYLLCNNQVVKSVTISGNFPSLKQGVFYGCSSLEGITIPASVSSIENFVFAGCSSLKKVVIEDRDDELKLGFNSYNNGSYSPLFSDCSLDYVYIGGDISYSTSSSYGYSPFYRNTTLRKVVITDKETEISTNEFYGCTNLQSFTVGDGVEKFGDWAFSGCSSLQSLSFGTQLKTIGKEAFSDCTSVTEITSKAVTPPACSSQALDDINKWNCQLLVPQGSLAAYQAADQWKEFFFISEGEGGGTTPEERKCATPVIVYKDETISFNCETEDVTFTYEITTADVQKGSASEVQLTQTYTVSVYATKAGYEKSDVATMDIKIAGGLKGDVNADGEVNVGDIVTVTNIMAGKDE